MDRSVVHFEKKDPSFSRKATSCLPTRVPPSGRVPPFVTASAVLTRSTLPPVRPCASKARLFTKEATRASLTYTHAPSAKPHNAPSPMAFSAPAPSPTQAVKSTASTFEQSEKASLPTSVMPAGSFSIVSSAWDKPLNAKEPMVVTPSAIWIFLIALACEAHGVSAAEAKSFIAPTPDTSSVPFSSSPATTSPGLSLPISHTALLTSARLLAAQSYEASFASLDSV